MKVEFLFSFISKRIKIKVNEDSLIRDAINFIISKEESLKDIEIGVILSCGSCLNINDSFKIAKIKDNDVITVMCDKKDENNDGENSNEDANSPLEFTYIKTITKDAHVNLPNADLNAYIDRTFDAFKSLKNQYLLIFPYSQNYKDYALVCYDIIKDLFLFLKSKAHSERVFTCRHFLDTYNKKDLLITGAFDKTIKIWNITDNFYLVYQKKPDYSFVKNTYLLSEALLYYKKTMYLIASAYEINSKGYNLLYYDINSKNNNKNVNIMPNSKDNTNYLNTIYMDNVPLIIAANCGNVKVFDFKNKKLLKQFSDNDNKINFLSVVIQMYKEKKCLISTSSDGFLRIWDYNNPSIIVYKIKSYIDNWLIGLELIDNQYLLAGCADGSIKEFDLLHNYVACTFPRDDKNDPVFTLRYLSINGQKYLFIHSHKGNIELWK